MVRIGIVGAGNKATEHARYFHESPRSRVVAVADPVVERARALADACGAAAVGDYQDLLDRADAVVLASPNFLHREQAVTSAAAGLHVFCEKPGGLSLADARDIAKAVRYAGVVCSVGFSERHKPPVQAMLRLLEEGWLGTPVALCSRRSFFFGPDMVPPWYLDPRNTGGHLLEISLHELDWMLVLGGQVSSVSARTRAAGRGTPGGVDQLWVTLGFDGGAVGTHEGSWSSALPVFFRGVEGTGGGASTDEWGNKLYIARHGERRVEIDPGPEFDLRANFLDGIEHGTPQVAGADWNLRVMAVADAVLESAATGTTTAVPRL